MRKHFSIPHEVVPSAAQIFSMGIQQLYVMNDPAPYVKPQMTIEYAELNDRVKLKTKFKHRHVKRPNRIVRGVKPILKELKELKDVRI